MNDEFMKKQINTSQLHSTIDKNKNGLVDRDEFLAFFVSEMAIPGVTRGELE